MIAVNGEPRDLQPGTTVRALLDLLEVGPAAAGVAVAVDREVVPRAQWPTFPIPEDAKVEVLTAVQGG